MRSKSPSHKHAYAKKLRKNLTKPEKLLWSRLSKKQLGVWFYSQSLVYGYIVDFWCPKAKLAVEVDGPHHQHQKRYDKKRDALLKQRGIKTLRVSTQSVENNLKATVALIKGTIKKRMK